MSDSQEPPEISETLVTTIEKVKKSRSPAQLETLSRAREKALVVRMQNAEMRRKQSEVDRAAATAVKRQRVEKLQREYDAVVETATPQRAVDHTSDEEVVERVVKRPKKKRVIVVEESSSDDEIEVRLPKPKKFAPPPDVKQQRYNRLYEKMFAID